MVTHTTSQAALSVREQLLLLPRERAELAAAGVSMPTIEALYPQAFEDSVPELIKRLDAAAAAEIQAFDQVAKRLRRLQLNLPRDVWQEIEAAHAASLTTEVELYQLHGYLAGRLGQPKQVEISERFTKERLSLDAINSGMWRMFWFAKNYHRFRFDQQAEIDSCAQQFATLLKLT